MVSCVVEWHPGLLVPYVDVDRVPVISLGEADPIRIPRQSEALYLLQRVRDEPAMLERLTAQGALRAPLFTPEAEQAALHRLLGTLTARTPDEIPR
ncbi:MAG: hypothetical protein HC793_04685 [Aquincola sp.]|nr:hypothetical protein [Aquincola sp.]